MGWSPRSKHHTWGQAFWEPGHIPSRRRGAVGRLPQPLKHLTPARAKAAPLAPSPILLVMGSRAQQLPWSPANDPEASGFSAWSVGGAPTGRSQQANSRNAGLRADADGHRAALQRAWQREAAQGSRQGSCREGAGLPHGQRDLQPLGPPGSSGTERPAPGLEGSCGGSWGYTWPPERIQALCFQRRAESLWRTRPEGPCEPVQTDAPQPRAQGAGLCQSPFAPGRAHVTGRPHRDARAHSLGRRL